MLSPGSHVREALIATVALAASYIPAPMNARPMRISRSCWEDAQALRYAWDFSITFQIERNTTEAGRLCVDQEIRPALRYGLVLSAWRTRQFIW